jgi:hypothetical protein
MMELDITAFGEDKESVWRVVVEYLYTDLIEETNETVLRPLLTLAGRLQLPRLVGLTRRQLGATDFVIPRASLGEDLRQYVASSHFADVRFLLPDANPIPAHKVILASRSAYFGYVCV